MPLLYVLHCWAFFLIFFLVSAYYTLRYMRGSRRMMLGVGIAIVLIAAFAVALICNTVISIGLLLIIATGINGLALLVLFLQYKKV